MTSSVCLTVDVEDFYEGMAVLGAPVERPGADDGQGLARLGEFLSSCESRPRITLFVVGGYAPTVASVLRDMVDAGHEVASHGPDHGRLPPAGDLPVWLRRGKEAIEDLLGVRVAGFRSPRFDLPAGGLARYRDALAAAGFDYVSDTHVLGAGSPVREVPVLTWRRVPVGGGSYQRLLPAHVVAGAVERATAPAVLYYHSYDFDGTLPGLQAARSLAVAKQLIGRERAARVFRYVAGRFGSESCGRIGI